MKKNRLRIAAALALVVPGGAAAEMPGICDQPLPVQEAILDQIGECNCGEVASSDLKKITILDLSSRGLDSLQKGMFDGLVSLEKLDLTRNRLASLPAGIFDDLVSLEQLDLTRNRLASLPAGIFDDLVSLEQLDLTREPVGVASGGNL